MKYILLRRNISLRFYRNICIDFSEEGKQNCIVPIFACFGKDIWINKDTVSLKLKAKLFYI